MLRRQQHFFAPLIPISLLYKKRLRLKSALSSEIFLDISAFLGYIMNVS